MTSHSERCSVNYKVEIARVVRVMFHLSWFAVDASILFLVDTFYYLDFCGCVYLIPLHLSHIGDATSVAATRTRAADSAPLIPDPPGTRNEPSNVQDKRSICTEKLSFSSCMLGCVSIVYRSQDSSSRSRYFGHVHGPSPSAPAISNRASMNLSIFLVTLLPTSLRRPICPIWL